METSVLTNAPPRPVAPSLACSPRPPSYRSVAALQIYFHRRTDVTSLSWQRRVHRSSDASRTVDHPLSAPRQPLRKALAFALPPLSRARARVLSSICSQLFPAKLFAFQSAPFCRTTTSICSVKCGAHFRAPAEFQRKGASATRGAPHRWRKRRIT